MIVREFKAIITYNFMDKWLETAAKYEKCTAQEARENYGGGDLISLDRRISGQEVTMLECAYPAGENDFFEKEDNNFVIHESLFAEI